MISISAQQVSPQLRALFDPHQPASLRCFAVLDDFSSGGLIMTDDPDNPQWGIVREPADGTIYIGGTPNAEIVAQVIAELVKTGDVLIGLWEGDPWREKLPPKPDYTGHVLEWMDRAPERQLDDLIARLPSDLRIDPFDAELFARTEWYEDTVRGYGSAERFFALGGGFCLMRGDEILGEASYGRSSPTLAEMGILIYPPYRQMGYATALSAYTVQACEARGLATYWNTAKQNIASAAIARKLGYRSEREYQLLGWFKTAS
jgi:RimJ/RimL family protein N-acetyltransferase